MSTVYKFNQEDLFYNRVKTYPKKDFLIYDAKVYIDGGKNAGIKNHTTTVNENNVPQGFISLYELNVASNIILEQEPHQMGLLFILL